MGSAVQFLAARRAIIPPGFLPTNLQYEVLMGSVAYGVSGDTSDQDIYGWFIPPKDVLFPHMAGNVYGFDYHHGRDPATSCDPHCRDQYQQHHVAWEGISYDFAIYNVAKYFRLCMEGNPNMIDSLFVPETCVKHATAAGQLVRSRRKLFLSKAMWPKFKGYAYAQATKIKGAQDDPEVIAFRQYEDRIGVDHDTRLSEVEAELRRRGVEP